jgi:apolipoprotein N-acyltransferase
MPAPPSANLNPDDLAIPLCVDLDGTLIKTDLLWEYLAQLLRRNPLLIFAVLWWWSRGRARLKQQLARRVAPDPAALPYHLEFLAWLRAQKAAGRRLVLATASDIHMARPVAEYVGLFDEVLGSDGRTNLRSGNKLKLLTEKFGVRGFDYAGNSTADYAVWRGARRAVVVNASPTVLKTAARCTELGPTFCTHYSAWFIRRRVADELLIRSGYLAATGAGLVLAAAFPKPGIAGLAWVAPALMLLAARGRRGAESFRVGYAAGLAAALGSFAWLLLIPVPGFPVLGWVALSAYLAAYPAVWVWLVNYDETTPAADSWGRRSLWALTGAAAWVALEMLRARLFSGLPWNLLGVSQYALTPLIQIASVTGVYGVSFLIVWVSLSFYSAGRLILTRPSARFAWQGEIILPMFAAGILFAAGMFLLRPPEPAANPIGFTTKLPYLRVTFVQPSIPQTLLWNPTADARLFNRVLDLSRQGLTNDTDLLLWPEASLTRMIRYDDPTLRAVSDLARSNHVWMIISSDDAEPARNAAPGSDDADDFNSSFLVSPAGQLVNVYHKRKLVAFGEYIPLVRWLPFIKWFTPITGGFASGDRAVPFELPNLKVKTATLICFEDIFPDFVREYADDDTDFLVNLTNDGWFGEGSAQWQQAAAAVFRSVENGLPLLRCANTGLTCWIDAHGRIQQVLKDEGGTIYGPGTLTVEIPLLPPGAKRTPTYYHLHGDRFGWACVLIAMVLLAGKFRVKKS